MMSPSSRVIILAGLIAAGIASACAPTSPGEGSYFIACGAAMQVQIDPDFAQLSPGDTITVTAQFGTKAGCAPPATDGPGAWRYRSTDTVVAVVDSVSGLIRAKAMGKIFVGAYNVDSPFYADSLPVWVR
jgi:hypothetical protein